MNTFLNKIKKTYILLALLLSPLLLWIFWTFLYPLFSRAVIYPRYIQDSTSGYIILQPYKAQKYIRKLAPTATRWIKQIPRFSSLQPGPIRLDWFHNLPREFSLLFDYIPGTGFESRLILLEKRNSTAFIEELNSSRFLNEFCFIDWRSPLSSNVQKDLWINEGFVYGKKTWPTTGIHNFVSPPKLLKNKYLLELLWINREQNAIIILENLVRCFPRLNNTYLSTWYRALNNIEWIYLHVNLVEDNLISGSLFITPLSLAETTEIKESVFTLKEWIQLQLPSPIQLEINETSNTEHLRWDVRFYDFETRLKRALGNFSD